MGEEPKGGCRRLGFALSAGLLLPVALSGQGTGASGLEFRSGFWINLHHILFDEAFGDGSEGIDIQNSTSHGQHDDAWSQAIEYYSETFDGKDLLRRDMAAIKDALGAVGSDSLREVSTLDPQLVEILNAAGPAYQIRWWRKHDRANRRWIDQLLPLLVDHESFLAERLATLFKEEWPEDTLLVVVVFRANWAGAYTTLYPTRITIASDMPDPSPREALETLFHEASHALMETLRGAISARARLLGKLLQRRSLWHAVLFYTVGEVVRLRLPDYTPYAWQHGLWQRGWPGHLSALETT